MLVRAIAAGLFVLLAGAQVVRTAAVAESATDRPSQVAAVWPNHPDVLRSIAMAEVGSAAGQGQAPSSLTLARLERLATAAPLTPNPYLVQAAIAQREGDYARAEELLVIARKRDPRSAAARYLLADIYLRTGRMVPGLAEMSVLGRLVPRGGRQLAPALAEFARSPGALPQLRRILNVYPELEPALLAELARDSRNAELILELTGGRWGSGSAQWQARLLDRILRQGDFERAHAIWARLSGVGAEAGRGLFNPDFQELNAPPPFNWRLSSTSDGVAEPADGGLRILYFGRGDAVLAEQLLMIRPGRYRLEMHVAGASEGLSTLGWTLTCLPGETQVLELPLRPGGTAGVFTLPAGQCTAQRLQLRGRGQEFARTVDARISRLRLSKVPG